MEKQRQKGVESKECWNEYNKQKTYFKNYGKPVTQFPERLKREVFKIGGEVVLFLLDIKVS